MPDYKGVLTAHCGVHTVAIIPVISIATYRVSRCNSGRLPPILIKGNKMENIEISLNREYILAGDISASMQTVDAKCMGLNRYTYMLEKFKSFIQTTSDFDKHGGCTIMLFGQWVHKYEHANLSLVEDKLNRVDFEGLTMTDKLLQDAFEEHLEEKVKMLKEKELHPGTTLMVFTDGEPTDSASVKRVIMDIENKIDLETEFKIIFLTVGTVSTGINTFLQGLVKDSKKKIVSVFELDKINFIAAASGVV